MFQLLLFLLIIISTYADALECYPRSCHGSKHTLCKYLLHEFGPKCNIVQFNRLNQHLKKEIVYIHNVVKALSVIEDEKSSENVKSTSNNSSLRVTRYKWNNELALIAQKWSNQCDPGHDQCRDIDNFKVSQQFENIRSKDINKFVMYDFIKNWSHIKISDYEDTVFDGVETPSSVNNHTIIWDKIIHIGCGIIRFFDVGGWYNTYLVCNYYPDKS